MSSEDNVVTAGCEEKKDNSFDYFSWRSTQVSDMRAHTHSRPLLLQSDQRDYKSMDWILTCS